MLVIPAIDLIRGKCVRLHQGDYGKQQTYSADPVAQALKFQQAGFRRLHIVDLEGAREGRGKNRKSIERILQAVELPVQVGGGIRSQADIDELVNLGARYLIVGTVALENPAEFRQWILKFGADRFIVSLDVSSGKLKSRGWLHESPAGLDVVVQRLVASGIRQFICTDIEKDGTLEQPGYSTLTRLQELLPASHRLLAAGGVTHPNQIQKLKETGVHGAIVGRALYEGRTSLEEFARAG